MEYYKFGDRVETKILFGRYTGCWVPARVVRVDKKRGMIGVCVLNHQGYKMTKYQMHIPLCNIRRPQHQFKVNDRIFTKILRGRKQGMWIPAKIISINDDATYDLVVENHRLYQVTKYAVHVPQQYLVPGDSSILRPSSSVNRKSSISSSKLHRESKSTDSWRSRRHSNGSEEKSSSEEKKVSRVSKIGSKHRKSSDSEDFIITENSTLTPMRSISGQPARRLVGRERHSFFPPKAVSISIEQTVPGTDLWMYSGDKLDPRTRASRQELTEHPAAQQTKDEQYECSTTAHPEMGRIISNWEAEYDWPEESPKLYSPSGNVTDWSAFSPYTSPTNGSNGANVTERPSLRWSPKFTEGKENSLPSARGKVSYDFVDSCLPSSQAQSNRRDRIVTLGVNTCSRRLTEIRMDATLEDIATWLAEGAKSRSGAENRKRMVKMMSFREKKVPIRSDMGTSMDIRLGTKSQCNKLSDLLGKSVDSSKQGLAFFVGPINGELSYKIVAFNKDQLPEHSKTSTVML